MSRIFDALKKARGERPAAALPAPLPIHPLAPVATAAAPSAPERPRSIPHVPTRLVPFGPVPVLPPDVTRAMAGLRVSLESALNERIPRTVMFVASQGGEGTSTVAAQFAVSLAEDARLRVLLADMHPRRPAWTGRPDAGGGPRNLALMPLPSGLERTFAPEVLRAMLQPLAGAFDWIVLDGPPVLESPDAAPLSAAADGVVVVVQAGRTKRPVLARSVDLLGRAGGRVLGVVLNRRRLEIPEFIYRRI